MATSPQFVAVPVIGMATISTANTNRDGTGTLATIVTGATNGTRISEVRVKATVATSAGMIRFYIDDGVVANPLLIREIVVEAITLTDPDDETFEGAIYFSEGLILPNGWTLEASTHVANTFNVFALGGNF